MEHKPSYLILSRIMNAGGQILGHIIHTVIQHGNRLHLMGRFVGGRLQARCPYALYRLTQRATKFETVTHRSRKVVVVEEIFIHGAVKATVTNAPQSQLNKCGGKVS